MPRTRLEAIVRAIFFATLFVSLWTWFVPRWIAASKGVTLAIDPGFASGFLMAVGAMVMIRCVFAFAWTGRGTPAPWDPPRRLVVTGFYRWVRNPMYVGMGCFLVGEALVLPMIRNELLILTAILWGVVTLFIVLHEEPSLRAKFGDDYIEYCNHVRRWLPRLRPIVNPERSEGSS